jgi:hypothetical protein
MGKPTEGPYEVDDHADATGTVRIIAPAEGHIVAEGIDPCDGPLLAAAWDLLEALRGMMLPLPSDPIGHLIGRKKHCPGIEGKPCDAACASARAAIAKAEGSR